MSDQNTATPKLWTVKRVTWSYGLFDGDGKIICISDGFHQLSQLAHAVNNHARLVDLLKLVIAANAGQSVRHPISFELTERIEAALAAAEVKP